jgi:16S rRNA processing protein RimM
MAEERLIIGEIVKPQGVKGELKVKPITYDVSRFQKLEEVILERDGTLQRASVRVTRVEADAVFLFMDGVHDRDDAERMRGALLSVARKDAVKLPRDANFICDLIGLRGETDAGEDLGVLVDVLQPGGNDVYVFRGPRGEVLIPALKRVVLSVDVAAKRMVLSAKTLPEVAVFDDD